jgi:hypothetical protein
LINSESVGCEYGCGAADQLCRTFLIIFVRVLQPQRIAPSHDNDNGLYGSHSSCSNDNDGSVVRQGVLASIYLFFLSEIYS